MRVCHIVPSLEERHGGPSKSVRALAQALAARGTPTELLTTHERGQAMTTAHDTAAPLVFARDFPRRLCRSTGLRAHLGSHDYDVIHHHALWLLTLRYAQQAASRTRAPLVISPRGMMSGWAYAHNRLRKTMAQWLIHPGAFAQARGWHATSGDEADAIRRLGFRQPICVAPNGVELPSAAELDAAGAFWRRQCPMLEGRRVALFYSRFHRKKRVRELIECWASQPRGDWFLLLVGVPEEYAPAEIDAWIRTHGLAHSVAVRDGRAAPPPYAVADLFLLPSHSENFGLVVAEALAAGVPALVTDTTPWHDLGTHGAGWCGPWPEFAAEMNRALQCDVETLRAMGQRGAAWSRREFTWARAAELLADFYGTLRHD